MKSIIKWLLLCIGTAVTMPAVAQVVNNKPTVTIQQVWNGKQGKKGAYIWAAKDAAGNVLQQYPEYSYFQQLNSTVYIVGKGRPKSPYAVLKAEAFGIVDVLTAKEIFPVNAYSIVSNNNCLVHIVTKDKKHILLKTDGTPISNNVYDYATSPYPVFNGVKRDVFFQVRLNDKFGYIDSCGNLQTPIHFEEVRSFEEGKAIVKRNGKWTWLNATMQEVLPPTFTYLKYFNNDIVPYSTTPVIETYPQFKGGKLGLINSKGQRLTEEIYDDISFVNGTSCTAKLNGQWITVNINAPTATVAAATPILHKEFFKSGRYGYYKYGYKIGNDWLIKPMYDIAYEFGGGFAVVGQEGKDKIITLGGSEANAMEYGVINHTGKLVIPVKYKALWYYEDGLYGVAEGKPNNWMMGITDTAGRLIVPAVYNELGRLSEGLLTAKTAAGYGYITVKGRQVIPHKYIAATAFTNGYACVAAAPNSWYWINKNGEELMPGKRFTAVSDWDSTGRAWTWNKIDKWNRPDSAMQITKKGTIVATRPLNGPPAPPIPGRTRCSLCNGSGMAYKSKEVNSSFTNVEGMFAPVQKNTTYSYSYKVYEKNGACTRCGGDGYE